MTKEEKCELLISCKEDCKTIVRKLEKTIGVDAAFEYSMRALEIICRLDRELAALGPQITHVGEIMAEMKA